MSRKAFTLIELLVVISIVALLSSVVLASLNSARDKARMAAAKQFEAGLNHEAGDQAVGIWDFDECSGTTANDRSGYGDNGTLMNGPTWSTDTPSGTGCSISFDGIDDSVDVAANSVFQFNLSNSSAAWSGWIKTTAGAQQTFLTYSTSYNPRITVDGTYLEWYNSTAAVTSVPASLNDGLWHHIVITNENLLLKFYVDGALKSTGTSVSGTTANQINIGKKACGGCSDVNFTGKIDNVRVYAKALTAMEVGKLYAEERRAARVAGR